MRKDDPINMGMGKLGGQNMLFVRKFRFALEGSHLEPWSIKAVSVNLVKKQLVIKGYEVIETSQAPVRLLPATGKDVPIEVWARGLMEGRWPLERLVLTTYDGCGHPLYEYVFEGLSITDRELDFDMSTSDESVQVVRLDFNTYHRRLAIETKNYHWKLLVEGNDREIDIELDSRPTVDIEETQIDFHNSKMFLPGKTKWQNMTIYVSVDDLACLTNLINTGAQETCVSADFKMYDDQNLLEVWFIKNLWTKSFQRNKDQGILQVTYSIVSYNVKI